MQRKIPPSSDQTIVTEVLQRSDVCFYWSMMHEQLTASKLTASIGDQLQSTVPIRKHRFIEGQNNHSTYSNQSRKSLVSLPSKLRGNEKKGVSSAEKITKPQKSSTKKRRTKNTGSRSERLMLIYVVLVGLPIAVITHLFFKDDTVVTALVTTLSNALSLLLGFYFSRKKQ